MTPPERLADAFADELQAAGNGHSSDLTPWLETAALIAETTRKLPRLKDGELEDGLDDWAGRLAGKSEETILREIRETIELIEPVCDDAGAAVKAALERAGLLPQPKATDGVFVDWASFWAKDHTEIEWVYDDVLAKGRGHAMYAGHKTGKSLLMLWIAAQVVQRPENAVLYLDYEMSEADLYDRLDDMGFSEKTDFSRLKYALLPSLPPLDTKEGAEAIMALCELAIQDLGDVHLTVVMDTASRAVRGEEDKADTWRAFYSHAGIQLKRAGYTWVRLDHAGKDATKGQRGSSGKGDDVDVIWRLSKTESGLELKREAARMSWIPGHVLFKRSNNPLRYLRMVQDWPEGTHETALHLDRLKADPMITVREAKKLLKDHGVGVASSVTAAAVRWRRQREGGQ